MAHRGDAVHADSTKKGGRKDFPQRGSGSGTLRGGLAFESLHAQRASSISGKESTSGFPDLQSGMVFSNEKFRDAHPHRAKLNGLQADHVSKASSVRSDDDDVDDDNFAPPYSVEDVYPVSQNVSSGVSDGNLAESPEPHEPVKLPNEGMWNTTTPKTSVSDTVASNIEHISSGPIMIDTKGMSDRELIQVQYETILKLQESLKLSQQQLRALQRQTFREDRKPRTQTLHRVTCSCYEGRTAVTIFEDHPEFTAPVEATTDHITGRLRIGGPGDVDVFLDRNRDVVLLIYKDFSCEQSTLERRRLARVARRENLQPSDDRAAILIGQSFSIISASMIAALKEVFMAMPNVACYPKVEARELIPAPYTFFYHDKSAILARMRRLKDAAQQELQMLIDYFQESTVEEFRAADDHFGKGLASSSTMRYLFEPGQIIVRHENGQHITYQASSYLKPVDNSGLWSLEAWCWAFDGEFWKDYRRLTISASRQPDEVFPIHKLEAYPLKYSHITDLEQSIRERGRQFWSCRYRKYVCYSDTDTSELHHNDLRFMIDYSTYNSNLEDKTNADRQRRESLARDVLNLELPPEPMLLLLPHTLIGFDMLNKKWKTLKVSCIKDIDWNIDAFQSLVIDEETKICVQALVTNQVSVEKGTDMVYGKGNGLVILLHGPPGTGKTLTAESVAELAGRPLYRVTCGDIGTDSAAVEQHLQSAFDLGKAWGCVVLLDEADIFLEERSLHDLSRNALVSVFLRALEYYDGILILTTNRVGTFDEAFKSRIQLSLHYERLSETQRGKVWENFLNRLERIDEDRINIDDLRRHVKELARHEMNGRQIRNALTTARQLALFADETMNFTHLKRAIRVSTKFDQYLRDVKHGATDDDIARDEGVR